MMKNSKYKVAKYMRLSREDGDDRESESIENQRDIIDNYIKEHDDLEVVEEYIDDGYTGTNFNRPGFQKLLKDVQDEKVNCIITKDLSRFGRDHIETGYYLERYFPANRIRYIALGDRVDTLKSDGLQFLTFKLSFNDYYAQDISNKIKSVKNRKIEKGEFQGGIAPYGYKKDKKIKNHLVIDEYAANIVRDIFDMYVNKGMSTIKIADILNEKEIVAPAVYLDIPTFRNKKSKNPMGKYIWLRNQVNNILKNEVYIGNVVGGKFRKVSHKISKVRRTSPEEHVVVENMHEPIIDLYTWNKAQERLNARHTPRERKYDHPLKGLIFCKECGAIATLRCRTEQRKSGKIWRADYFVCSNRNSYRTLCECKQMKASLIEDEVKRILRNEIEHISYSNKEIKEIYKNAQKELKITKSGLEKDLNNCEQKIEMENKVLYALYEDKLNKVIKVEDFEMMYKEHYTKKKENIKKMKSIKAEIRKVEETLNNIDTKELLEKTKEYLSLNNMTKEMYQNLIERIEIDKERNIFIKFKFAKYTEK